MECTVCGTETHDRNARPICPECEQDGWTMEEGKSVFIEETDEDEPEADDDFGFGYEPYDERCME